MCTLIVIQYNTVLYNKYIQAQHLLPSQFLFCFLSPSAFRGFRRVLRTPRLGGEGRGVAGNGEVAPPRAVCARGKSLRGIAIERTKSLARMVDGDSDNKRKRSLVTWLRQERGEGEVARCTDGGRRRQRQQKNELNFWGRWMATGENSCCLALVVRRKIKPVSCLVD